MRRLSTPRIDDPLLQRVRRIVAAASSRAPRSAASAEAVLADIAELSGLLRLLLDERDRLGGEIDRLARREQALAAYLSTTRLGPGGRPRPPRRRP